MTDQIKKATGSLHRGPVFVFDEFGAMGDGVTDDSDAIQRTFDAAARYGPSSIVTGRDGATYRIEKTIETDIPRVVRGGESGEGSQWGGEGTMTMVDTYPPVAELSDTLPAVMFYEDGDGSYFVPVEEEPDQRAAWRRAEASASVALVPDGRATVPISECEDGHYCNSVDAFPCDAHPGCPATPCPEPEPTDVWVFLNVDDRDEFRAGLAFEWAVR